MGQKSAADISNIVKDKAIKKETRRLAAIYQNIDENKRKVVDGLIKRAAFLAVSLAELEGIINDSGYTCEYQNGENQRGTKETPEVKIHIAMVKNYALVIRQLAELAPPAPKKQSALQKLMEE